uniref:Uncharacterized protein n=1 Tax=Trichuris muris TaxID=70415 RepID=A0A5S6QPU1_TRIMR
MPQTPDRPTGKYLRRLRPPPMLRPTSQWPRAVELPIQQQGAVGRPLSTINCPAAGGHRRIGRKGKERNAREHLAISSVDSKVFEGLDLSKVPIDCSLASPI